MDGPGRCHGDRVKRADAETLAKTALLSGPASAADVLAPGGGVVFFAGGRVEGVGVAAEVIA